jgi:hypothetical protein
MIKYLCENISEFKYLQTIYDNIYHGSFTSARIILIKDNKYFGYCFHNDCETCDRICTDIDIIDVNTLIRKEKLNRIIND